MVIYHRDLENTSMALARTCLTINFSKFIDVTHKKPKMLLMNRKMCEDFLEAETWLAYLT